MTEKISKKAFENNRRRICIKETENTRTGMGEDIDLLAQACSFRAPETIEFTEKYFKGQKFAECLHPNHHEPTALFCPPKIHRINQEPGDHY